MEIKHVKEELYQKVIITIIEGKTSYTMIRWRVSEGCLSRSRKAPERRHWSWVLTDD